MKIEIKAIPNYQHRSKDVVYKHVADELLEALQELTGIVEGVISDGDEVDSFTLQFARKAINKALK